MTDYKRMYQLLCRATSDALDILPDLREKNGVRLLLQKALIEAEDIYIQTANGDYEREEYNHKLLRFLNLE